MASNGKPVRKPRRSAAKRTRPPRRLRDQAATVDSEPVENTPVPAGVGGGLYERAANIRSDARLAARLISLNVVPVDTTERVLAASFDLAAKAADGNKPRKYARVMGVPIAVARLAQSERLGYDRLDPLD
jgi:hypothetical protein